MGEGLASIALFVSPALAGPGPHEREWTTSGLGSFLRPTVCKLAFLLGWGLYAVVYLVGARFERSAVGANLVWPAVFLYLVGCAIVAASRYWRRSHRVRTLIAMALGLVAVDHVAKIAALSLIPYGESIPVVPGRLHLVQVTNAVGSWFFAGLGSPSVVAPALVVTVVLALAAPLLFRYYAARFRESFWCEVAFVCLFASSVSSAVDLGLRGGVVDYLLIPGHFAMDLKDLVSEVFVAGAVVEAVDNPAIELRWRGWRAEFVDLGKSVVGIVRFAVGEMKWGRRNR